MRTKDFVPPSRACQCGNQSSQWCEPAAGKGGRVPFAVVLSLKLLPQKNQSSHLSRPITTELSSPIASMAKEYSQKNSTRLTVTEL
jgi:hypothetical protein